MKQEELCLRNENDIKLRREREERKGRKKERERDLGVTNHSGPAMSATRFFLWTFYHRNEPVPFSV